MRLTVSFCCNDPDNGNFAGCVAGIEIHGVDGCDIRFEPRRLPDPKFTLVEGVSKRFQAKGDTGRFRVARLLFGCSAWSSWYGNWCWDATRMRFEEVLRLCRALRHAGWSCDEADVAFGEAFDLGATHITRELLLAALRPDHAEVTR